MITRDIQQKIFNTTSVFECGKPEPAYDTLVVLRDGPKDGKGNRTYQITYGKHQTTESSHLKTLVKMYCDGYGKYTNQLRPYLSKIGVAPLHTSEPFKRLLKEAALDPMMQECQDKLFEQFYWKPAFNFFIANKFTLPLSMLVIYDSYIHSGGIPAWLRDDFKEVVPVKGGSEKAWITAYVKARDYWLENHSDKLLRNTDYRTDCFLEQILNNNWDLSQPIVVKFNNPKSHAWVTVK